MAYTLYIYDCYRCGYDIRLNRSPLSSVLANLDKLRQEQLGPSVIFERLALRLLQSFPFPQESALWLNCNPLEAVRQLQSGLWELAVADERADEFLKVLLPLTRALLLTVVDPQRGLLVQFQRFYEDGFVCAQAGMDGYHSLDSNAATDKFTKAMLRKRLLERLTPALAEHGFHYETKKYSNVYFRRPLGTVGEQIIKGDLNLLRSEYCLEKPTLEGPYPFRLELVYLRWLMQPNWRNEPLEPYDLARNFEWVDWLAEDILAYGLPVLDKARTIEGVDWLYNAPEAVTVFPHNIYGNRPIHWLDASSAVYAAAEARNPRFEEIAPNLLEKFAGKPGEPETRSYTDFKELVARCRAKLQASDSILK